MRLVVDANLIIERDWYLTSGTAEALLAAAKHGRLHLVVPEVVLQEVVTAQKEREAAALKKADAARAALRKLIGPRVDHPPNQEQQLMAGSTYESWLRDKLGENRVEIPEIPNIARGLVERALQRRRPFDSTGRSGFRDTMIWHAVLDSASDAETTLFATANTRDFAAEDKQGLHEHLLEDLRAKGLADNAVQWVGSLESAARLALEPATQVLHALRNKLVMDQDWADALFGELQQELAAAWPFVDDSGVFAAIDSAAAPFERDVTSEELEDVEILGPPSVADAYPMTGDVYAVHIEAPAHATYALEVDTGGFRRQPDRVPRGVELSVDESVAYVRALAQVRAVFDARYSSQTHELTEISLVGVVD